MNLYTIGFTQKKAETFFNLIKENKVKNLFDVRLNNISQLSGFAKRDDLKFFLKELCGTEYQHLPELAPTQDILKAYQKKETSWEKYEDQFLGLMSQRQIEKHLKASLLDDGCLLCSEHKPHFCHRRLVVDYLNSEWQTNLNVKHLL